MRLQGLGKYEIPNGISISIIEPTSKYIKRGLIKLIDASSLNAKM
jgi:hypothetical protein